MRKIIFVLAALALAACGSLGSETTFPAVQLTTGITSFRPTTAQETGLGGTDGKSLELQPRGTIERVSVASSTLFYAWAPVLVPAPTRDPAAVGVDYTQFEPRRIARSASTNGLAFTSGPDVLTATETWEGGAVFDPYVIVLSSGTVRLYYAAGGGIGVAEASSIDGTFVRVGTAPVLADVPGFGVPRSPSVVVDGAGFLLFFEAGGRLFAGQSNDGLAITLIDGDVTTPALDPLSLPPTPAEVPDGGYAPDASIPATETAQIFPYAVRAKTLEGRDQLRLYFQGVMSDGKDVINVAASYGGLPLERAPIPAINKKAPTIPSPEVRGDVTVLYATVSAMLAGGVTARNLVSYVSPAVAALPDLPPP